MKNLQNTANMPTKIQDLRSTEFLNRIRKSLYYPENPATNYLSLPLLELASEFFTEASGHLLEKLDMDVTSRISNTTSASPCALVLALLYIERLKNCNPKYLQQVAPFELFLISLMVPAVNVVNCAILKVRRFSIEFSPPWFIFASSEETLTKLEWEILPYAAYSPDLAPSDYHLFRSMQHDLQNMVASKFLHDDGSEDEVVDAVWAISGRITLSRTIKLEMEFLKAVNWMVSVREEIFWEKLQQLEKEVAYREVRKRGWCSYTELNCLMNSSQLITIANSLILVCSICLTAYVACFLIMFGSTFVLQTITSCGMLFVRSWQFMNSNETDITSYSNISPNLFTSVRFCVFNNEHVMSIYSLFSGYKNEDYIIAKIQNRSDYVGDDVNNSDDSNDSWQWWLNSTMTWLAEYSDFKNFTSQVTKFDDTGSIFDDVKFSFNSTQYERIRNMKDFMLYWQKVLYSILNRLTTHWTRLNDLHRKIFLQSINSIDFLVQSRRFDR